MNNTFKKRIDELGRIVIPKQIRTTFKIKDFDELELFVENDNIVLKKTGGILLIKDKLNNFLKYIKKYNNIDAFIVDKNELVASNNENISNVSNINFDEYINNNSYLELKIDNNYTLKGYIKVFNLIYDSNSYGSIIFTLNENNKDNLEIIKDILNIVLDYIK